MKLFLSTYLLLLFQNILIGIDISIEKELEQPQIKIILSPEEGVAYFLRDSQDFNEWQLVETNPVLNESEINLPINNSENFYLLESRFERRARIFIKNYLNQLENGGPSKLILNGIEVQNNISIEEDRANNEMVVTANGIPNYIPTILGIDVTNGFSGNNDFKSLKLTENNLGASGNNNPNQIVLAEEIFKIPLNPVYNNTVTDTPLGTVGVSVNGIPIYNPFEDPNETAAYGRIFSSCCGHPQLNGVYHYHKYPTCLRFIEGDNFKSEKDKCDEIDALVTNGEHSPLIGFALDGWPIYGPVGWLDDSRQSKILKSSYTGSLDSSANPTFIENSGDLDMCNGIISPTPEFPEGIYHYVMTVKSNSDGTIFRYLNPHFGYDVRSTFLKHSISPEDWESDPQYIEDLKTGFFVNNINIPGTDSYSTFVDFIQGMQAILINNNLSELASEFETMQIEYPYTVRMYRGNTSNANTGTIRNFTIDSSLISPTEISNNSGIIEINLSDVQGPPVPRNLISITLNNNELYGINFTNNLARGSFDTLVNGNYTVTATFQTRNGTIFNYICEDSFTINAP